MRVQALFSSRDQLIQSGFFDDAVDSFITKVVEDKQAEKENTIQSVGDDKSFQKPLEITVR